MTDPWGIQRHPEAPSIEEQEWELEQDAKRRTAERRFDEGFAEYERSLLGQAGDGER